ncbi:MAG: TIGR00282 family metallophosphoesterase [bacterium]|nr:TIGR00282 family metallophosphoesterase [bacterium]
MRILFLGDIVGRPGRNTVRELLPGIIQEVSPDLIIANAENIAGGKGMNRKTIQEMMDLGIDVFTGGNHSFKNTEGVELLESGQLPVLRPANFPIGTAGTGWRIVRSRSGKRVLVISLIARIFMPQFVDSPFQSLEDILKSVSPGDYDASFVDFHGEATSEKQALRWTFDGKVSAIVGTHTHVQTADADVSQLGTAYVTDTGMCGSLDSCIGVEKDIIIRLMKTQMPVTHVLEKRGRMQLNGTLIDIAEDGKAMQIAIVRKIV